MDGDRRVVLYGDPVDHSLSPLFQNAAFRALGLPYEYDAVRVEASHLPDAVRTLRDAAYLGGNLTVPHKEAVLRHVDALDPNAEVVGAANTLYKSEGLLRADNTDMDGFLAALREDLGLVPYNARALVLGAGGAARAVVAALLSGGAAEVGIHNRSARRASLLADAMRERLGGRVLALDSSAALALGGDVDLVVNCTSVGLDGSGIPLQGLCLRPGAAFMDLVYRPTPTPLMRHLSQAGVPTADGLSMLLYQGASSFVRWTGREAPLAVMRAALVEAVDRRHAGNVI